VSRQKLGQHFLIKGSVLERIAAAACPNREPLVVEIGPGKGALTERLLARADRVVAIELDDYLAEHLRKKFPQRLEVAHADVLETDLNQWGLAVVAGNLPYYIATPILSRVLAPGSPFARGVLLIQKEVAERVTAQPGSRAYGYLSVESQFHADVRMLFEVRPSAFHPPPKVDSALISFTRHSGGTELGIESPGEFLKFVRLCFQHKRKTIRNNLMGAYPADVIATLPQASLRAEQLSIEQFAEMYRRVGVEHARPWGIRSRDRNHL
jgi:16S rRNA (adenine1518-N6/adenine1519-N6)-dimethyltransferase